MAAEEGDIVERVSFVTQGLLAYVLPKYDNMVFVTVEKGDMIGMVDLVPDKNENVKIIGRPRRKFNVQVISESCEMMVIYIDDFQKIKKNFPLIYDELFVEAILSCKRLNVLKANAVQYAMKN